MNGDDREPWLRVWFPPILILAPPWLAAAISVGIAMTPELESILEETLGSRSVSWIVRVNGLLALTASSYGGLFAKGPVGTRVAVAIATGVYGFAVYMILMGLSQILGVRFSF